MELLVFAKDNPVHEVVRAFQVEVLILCESGNKTSLTNLWTRYLCLWHAVTILVAGHTSISHPPHGQYRGHVNLGGNHPMLSFLRES